MRWNVKWQMAICRSEREKHESARKGKTGIPIAFWTIKAPRHWGAGAWRDKWNTQAK